MIPESLSIEERCRILGGASTWRTHAIENAAIPAIKMSDGPNGVRGEAEGADLLPGVVVPVGIALGATWNVELLGQIGDLLGLESRRKGVHVLLGPTVNLQRTPIGGRVFEAYSEDPELTARLGVAFVKGVQAHEVAVTVKHFVANDTEIERMDVDAIIDESTLRELYLRPFEAMVKEANAWGIMSAYNQLNGEFCAHNRWLLHDVLRKEWGFDGFVVSDWGGVHETEPAVHAGLTIAMPGPRTVYGENLAIAFEHGRVEEADINDRVSEVLKLIERTRAGERSADKPQESIDDPKERALARQAATEAMVLLRNEGHLLPLEPSTKVALIGANAEATRIMGGGSSSMESHPYQSIKEAVVERFGEESVRYELGATIDKYLPPFTGSALRTPDGEIGLLAEFRNGRDLDSPIVSTTVVYSTNYRSFGNPPLGVGEGHFWVTLRGELIPDHDGPYELGAIVGGKAHVTVADQMLVDDPRRALPRGDWTFGHGSEEQKMVVEAQAGVPIPVRIDCSGINGFAVFTLGGAPLNPPPYLERAVEAAREADVAVVVVGTNDEWETEGVDRTTISLPGDQDDLIRQVVAAAQKTVVVVNAGGPVAMDWANEVDAIFTAPFAGEETGPAVAAILAGDAEPSGRLPITYPRRLEDSPAWPYYRPLNGKQRYGEGRLMGYRGFEANGVEPLWPFGHGLGYGTVTWSKPALSTTEIDGDSTVAISVALTAGSDRDRHEVVQVYITHPNGEMPPKTLAGFAKVLVPAGETVTATIELSQVAWRRFDSTNGDWVVDPGERKVLVAASSADIRAELNLRIR